MSSLYDVIVIGVGSMGSAACHHLAARGARVLGLEKFGLPHAHGSGHGFSRLIRSSYREHPGYVNLVRSAFGLWRELEKESGQSLLEVTGGLYMGPRDGRTVGGAKDAAERFGLPFELLDPGALRSRFPQFRLPDSFYGFWEPEAGFIRPEQAIAAHALCALRRGAELHGQEAVREWSEDDSGVRVVTERGAYRARQLIFCGGAWTDSLVKDLGVPLRVTRQALGWVWPKRPAAFELGRLPVWAIDRLDGSSHYGFPMIADSPGFKLAHHQAGAEVDPDCVRREPGPGDEESFRSVLREHIPDADGPLLSLRICLYTYSPDGHFIIDRHPRHPRVLLACGFSGHGFKFAPVIGEILADLALTEHTRHPIDFLRLSRFL